MSSPLAAPLAWDLVSSGYADESFAHFARYAADALSLAAATSTDAILDVAAGPGSLSVQAAQKVSRVTALDFSRKMLDQLKLRLAAGQVTNVDVHEGDGQALPFSDASYDAAFSMFGLMFFPDRAKGFSELFRVLKPGGRAVVASWQPMSKVPVLMAIFEALAAELPQLPFGDGKGPLTEREAFAAEMSAAGFTVSVESRVHAIEAENISTFWKSTRRSLAPLVLLEDRMGSDAFEPVAEAIRRRLEEKYAGPLRIEMPAWLAHGTKE